jgi:hypothetical protein
MIQVSNNENNPNSPPMGDWRLMWPWLSFTCAMLVISRLSLDSPFSSSLTYTILLKSADHHDDDDDDLAGSSNSAAFITDFSLIKPYPSYKYNINIIPILNAQQSSNVSR